MHRKIGASTGQWDCSSLNSEPGNECQKQRRRNKQENLVQQTYNTIQTTCTSSSGLHVFSLSIHFVIDQLFVYTLLKNSEMSVKKAQGDISSPKLRYPVYAYEKETEKKQHILMYRRFKTSMFD